MHEASLVHSIFEEVRQYLESNHAARITNIQLEIGTYSNIEPLLLREAFNVLKNGTPFETTTLTVEPVTAEARCYTCGKIFQPAEFPFYCPACGHYGGELIRGHDLIIKRIEMEVPEHA